MPVDLVVCWAHGVIQPPIGMNLASDSKGFRIGIAALLLALIAQFALLYPRLRARDAEISALHANLKAMERSEVERHELATQLVARDVELVRLRKDNQELHRLRNEVRQVREAARQADLAARAGTASEPTEAADELVGRLQRQVQQLQLENAQLRAAEQQAIELRDRALELEHGCINNLRQIEGAKQQWALENVQPEGALPEPADLEPYLRDPAVWFCPADGFYILNAVGFAPVCSVPGHALP
jgi:hypothetical protein